MRVRCQAGWKDYTRRQRCIQSHYCWSDHGGGGSIAHAVKQLASRGETKITHAIILTESINIMQNVESGMSCLKWHTAMHSLRLQKCLWVCLNHAGFRGNKGRLANIKAITAWQDRGSWRIGELSVHGQTRTSQHWLPDGKRCEQKKRPTLHPLKSGTICFKTHYHWNCLKGNVCVDCW